MLWSAQKRVFAMVYHRLKSSVFLAYKYLWDIYSNSYLKCLQVSQDPLSIVKRDLEGWREVLLPLNRLINWDKPFYPAIIVGVNTFIFL